MGVFIDFVFGAPPQLVRLETIAFIDSLSALCLGTINLKPKI